MNKKVLSALRIFLALFVFWGFHASAKANAVKSPLLCQKLLTPAKSKLSRLCRIIIGKSKAYCEDVVQTKGLRLVLTDAKPQDSKITWGGLIHELDSIYLRPSLPHSPALFKGWTPFFAPASRARLLNRAQFWPQRFVHWIFTGDSHKYVRPFYFIRQSFIDKPVQYISYKVAGKSKQFSNLIVYMFIVPFALNPVHQPVEQFIQNTIGKQQTAVYLSEVQSALQSNHQTANQMFHATQYFEDYIALHPETKPEQIQSLKWGYMQNLQSLYAALAHIQSEKPSTQDQIKLLSSAPLFEATKMFMQKTKMLSENGDILSKSENAVSAVLESFKSLYVSYSHMDSLSLTTEGPESTLTKLDTIKAQLEPIRKKTASQQDLLQQRQHFLLAIQKQHWDTQKWTQFLSENQAVPPAIKDVLLEKTKQHTYSLISQKTVQNWLNSAVRSAFNQATTVLWEQDIFNTYIDNREAILAISSQEALSIYKSANVKNELLKVFYDNLNKNHMIAIDQLVTALQNGSSNISKDQAQKIAQLMESKSSPAVDVNKFLQATGGLKEFFTPQALETLQENLGDKSSTQNHMAKNAVKSIFAFYAKTFFKDAKSRLEAGYHPALLEKTLGQIQGLSPSIKARLLQHARSSNGKDFDQKDIDPVLQILNDKLVPPSHLSEAVEVISVQDFAKTLDDTSLNTLSSLLRFYLLGSIELEEALYYTQEQLYNVFAYNLHSICQKQGTAPETCPSLGAKDNLKTLQLDIFQHLKTFPNNTLLQ